MVFFKSRHHFLTEEIDIKESNFDDFLSLMHKSSQVKSKKYFHKSFLLGKNLCSVGSSQILLHKCGHTIVCTLSFLSQTNAGFWSWKGPFVNYVITFQPIFDQINMFTTQGLHIYIFSKASILVTNYVIYDWPRIQKMNKQVFF